MRRISSAWEFLDENLWWFCGFVLVLGLLSLEHCRERECVAQGWSPEECAKL